MNTKGYIVLGFLMCLNFIIGIVNIKLESYYFAALCFIAVGIVGGMIVAAIIDNRTIPKMIR